MLLAALAAAPAPRDRHTVRDRPRQVIDLSIILELKRPAIGGSGLLVSPMIEKSTTGAVSGADEGELAHLVPQMIDESNTGSVSVANDEAPASSDITAS